MDLIKDILESRGGDLVQALVGQAGFDADRAKAFVPEAGSSVLDALTSRASDLDLGDLASQSNVDRLVDHIDVGDLASRAGVSAQESSRGLAAFVPMVLGFLGEKSDAGGLLALLGKADDVGDVLGKLGGIGKLFG